MGYIQTQSYQKIERQHCIQEGGIKYRQNCRMYEQNEVPKWLTVHRLLIHSEDSSRQSCKSIAKQNEKTRIKQRQITTTRYTILSQRYQSQKNRYLYVCQEIKKTIKVEDCMEPFHNMILQFHNMIIQNDKTGIKQQQQQSVMTVTEKETSTYQRNTSHFPQSFLQAQRYNDSVANTSPSGSTNNTNYYHSISCLRRVTK